MGQAGRYELKYVIDEERAIAVADYCRAFLRPSVHNGEERPTRGHPVISIYMDSPDFFFFRQAYFGHLNRIKLRIRCYDDHWERPAFFEIKRRVMDVICKDRAMLSREAVEFFLNSGWPNPARHDHGEVVEVRGSNRVQRRSITRGSLGRNIRIGEGRQSQRIIDEGLGRQQTAVEICIAASRN
jgi:hypothetical protein